ncbi:MAG: hypothetical protein IKD45_06070 [Clostridia bacterium]|nr:hypothetical protein [Clostridia bacterium]
MKYCIVDERLPAPCESALTEKGFGIIKLAPISALPSPIASHTDIILFKNKSNIICSERYLSENPEIRASLYGLSSFINIKECREYPFGEYPRDAIFNALTVGERLFARCESVCRDILEYAEEAGLSVINVKQGYPACTVLAIGEDAAITSDRGMARALIFAGVDTLLIDEDSAISLPPYKNGFIGGTAGRIGKDIYFAGNISALRDGENVTRFIESHGYVPHSLAPDASGLCDLGGLFFYEDNA